jgi:hypothetical protein
MNPRHLPRQRGPSLRTITVTLLCALALCVAEVMLASWFISWWRGVWS